ncbi:hypothetical protein [Ketogulonicigenium vulgare]|uniref:DUF2946 domain-containing protein n=1 Tax=Ketogulonicigenium vulgare (strain WSH-001) TaxID=759362 RepID=F9Y866_KETVW|nr:hypothetical protein [Ketogulonicigenium vulgare]AEM42352.1 hypothetical protein KVU_2513 [Ketogulonicigenium vulgare WSH-001]ALJ79977.1 hypothetical protein KVH_01510 [Ketogulonicigenium vulgare]AOZ53436.1 hypothetical protein KVC_0410 [Ketogulonicigenium vulgare]
MSLYRRKITAEIGAALAVLGLWLLVIISPLHQVSAFARDAGFGTPWTICNVPQEHGSASHDPMMMACPVHAIGKNHLDLALPPVLAAQILHTTFAYANLTMPARLAWSRIHLEPGQPRAPPAVL